MDESYKQKLIDLNAGVISEDDYYNEYDMCYHLYSYIFHHSGDIGDIRGVLNKYAILTIYSVVSLSRPNNHIFNILINANHDNINQLNEEDIDITIYTRKTEWYDPITESEYNTTIVQISDNNLLQSLCIGAFIKGYLHESYITLNLFRNLVDRGLDIHHINSYGCNILHFVCMYNMKEEKYVLEIFEIIKYLVEECGVNIDQVDNFGRKPINILISNCREIDDNGYSWDIDEYDIVKYLKQQGSELEY